MRYASALSRFVAPMIAVGVAVGGCGQASSPTSLVAAPPAASAAAATLPAGAAPAPAPAAPNQTAPNRAAPNPTVPDFPASDAGSSVSGSAVRQAVARAAAPPALAPGSVFRNPASGRDEVILADVRRTAVLIGDSQSEPDHGWTRQGLAAAGYSVYFAGRGGTGYVASNGQTGNYIDALERGDWKLPFGDPPLVVLAGGGNDAARGASNAQIVANAERLIARIKQRYPEARLAMIGTLARGANYGGGRRTEVDALLGSLARRHALPYVGVGDWLTKYRLTHLMADSVHMSKQGHNALGAILGRRIESLGLTARHLERPGLAAMRLDGLGNTGVGKLRRPSD